MIKDGYICPKCNEYYNENEMLLSGLCTYCDREENIYSIEIKRIIEKIIDDSTSFDEVQLAKRLLRKFETKTLNLKDVQLVKDITIELGLNVD